MKNHAAFPRGADGRAAIEGSLSVVASFALAVERGTRVDDAFRTLATLLRADAVLLSRIGPNGVGQRLAAFDAEAGRLFTPRNRPALAADVVALATLRPRRGSVLVLSDIAEPSQRRDLNEKRDFSIWMIRDVACVLLGGERDHQDVLELQYRTEFPRHQLALLSSLGAMLASLWRADVVAARRLDPVASVAPPEQLDILSPDNPIHLSRAEFRVCQLVRNGQRAREIARELAISECTVRTHLRSIYSKANVSGQVGLMYLMITHEGRMSGPGIQSGDRFSGQRQARMR